MKDEEERINMELYVVVTHSKMSNTVWTCGKDNIIRENYEYKAIIL